MLREAAKMSLTCVDPNARGRSTATHTHPPLTKGQGQGEEKPAAQCIQEDTRRSTAIHIVPQNSNANSTHPQPQQEERGASKSTTVLYLPLPRRNSVTPHSRSWHPTLTVRHGAHHPLPSERTHQGAQSPSHHRNGGTQTINVADYRCF
ncbi:hypothetical protein TcCL_NonESM09435 [Trypanosoma cruzi]|nr:hypothetical protein TcCL_NonESM09435 [Trypanosoma cruzi]